MIRPRRKLQPERLETVLQQLPALGMAGPGGVEALVEDRAQAGVERRDHGHRRRVVVDPPAFTRSWT